MIFTLFGSLSIITSVFVSPSPSPTWEALYNPSPSCPSSPCSRELPHKVPEPKRPSPLPGRTTRWTSAWTSWARECSRPSPCSPASTPCNKVRGAAEPWCSARAGSVPTKLHVIYSKFTASAECCRRRSKTQLLKSMCRFTQATERPHFKNVPEAV